MRYYQMQNDFVQFEYIKISYVILIIRLCETLLCIIWLWQERARVPKNPPPEIEASCGPQVWRGFKPKLVFSSADNRWCSSLLQESPLSSQAAIAFNTCCGVKSWSAIIAATWHRQSACPLKPWRHDAWKLMSYVGKTRMVPTHGPSIRAMANRCRLQSRSYVSPFDCGIYYLIFPFYLFLCFLLVFFPFYEPF